jgi:hypothetical protein
MKSIDRDAPSSQTEPHLNVRPGPKWNVPAAVKEAIADGGGGRSRFHEAVATKKKGTPR